MTYVLILIALKSVIVAGGTLGLLSLLKKRSAAERSWVAHIGLVALLMLAFAPLVLPSLTVEGPAWLNPAAPVAESTQTPAPSSVAVQTPGSEPAATPVPVERSWSL